MSNLPNELNLFGHTFTYTTTFQHSREYKNRDTNSCLSWIDICEVTTSTVEVCVSRRIFDLDVPDLSKFTKYDVLQTIASRINDHVVELVRYKDVSDTEIGLAEYRQNLKVSLSRDLESLQAFNQEFF